MKIRVERNRHFEGRGRMLGLLSRAVITGIAGGGVWALFAFMKWGIATPEGLLAYLAGVIIMAMVEMIWLLRKDGG